MNQITATFSHKPFEIEYAYADTGRVFLRDRHAGPTSVGSEHETVRESFRRNFDTSSNKLISIQVFQSA